MKRIKTHHIIIAFVLGVFVIAVVPDVFTDHPDPGVIITEDEMTVINEGVETNATLEHEIMISVLSQEPERDMEFLVGLLGGVPGVGRVVLTVDDLWLTVEYDETVIAGGTIFVWLTDEGYLLPSSADATPMEVAEDGSVQRIRIADVGDRFSPHLVLAKAGVPIEMEFSPGQQTRDVVRIPAAGIEQNIALGGTVAVPALEPGVYQIASGAGTQEGILYVE